MSGNSEISGNSEKLTGGSGIKEDQSEVKNLSQTRGNTYLDSSVIVLAQLPAQLHPVVEIPAQ